MKTIKPQRLALLCRAFEHRRAQRLVLCVGVMIDMERSAIPLPETELWRVVGEELAGAPLDEVMPKPRADLILDARAFAPGGQPVPACTVRAQVGPIDKTLGVVGDRYWETISREPTPFTEMPIDYAHAFGGDGYALNPRGKGAHPVETPHGRLHPLPNIEDPRRLVRGPADCPPPAGFAPYDLGWPQRSAKAGTYDSAWFEHRYPGLPDDADPTIFNVAPDDQQIDGAFAGDEAYTFENLHPTKPKITSRLSGLRARVIASQRTAGGEATHDVPMRLDTLRFIPHVLRAILLFRGVLDIAEDDASDVSTVLAALEDAATPRPIDHYLEVMRRRADRRRGAAFALEEHELLPSRLAALLRAERSTDSRSPAIRGQGLLEANRRRRIANEVAAARGELERSGLPSEGLDAPVPSSEISPELILQAMDDAEAAEARARVESEKARALAEAQLRERCEALGVDYDRARAERAETGGPPRFSADAELRRLAETAASARGAGAPALHVERMLTDATFRQRLVTAERAMREAYRRFAHQQPPARRAQGEDAYRRRSMVEAAARSRSSLAGADLTGLDLTGIDLHGMDLRGAHLERARLVGVNLSDARLDEAVLARAELADAQLIGASMRGTSVAAASLDRATLDGADLTGAIVAEAVLAGASLRGATLVGADLMGATLANTDLGDARAQGLLLMKAALKHVRFVGADLARSTFIECDVTDADFTGADLTSATLLDTTADGAVFREACLVNARFVGRTSLLRCGFQSARIAGANLRRIAASRADFSDADLTGADLSEADLRDADLSRVRARGARLTRSEASRARFVVADLMDALLQKANVCGADFTGANLYRADLARIRLDTATSFRDANLKRARVRPGAQA